MTPALRPDQRELLEDKYVLWTTSAQNGRADFRDYNRRAAEALKAALAICAEFIPTPHQEPR